MRGSSAVYTHVHLCKLSSLKSRASTPNVLQGVRAIFSTSQSLYLDVFESWTPCVWRCNEYSLILSDRNSDKRDKEDQGQKIDSPDLRIDR